MGLNQRTYLSTCSECTCPYPRFLKPVPEPSWGLLYPFCASVEKVYKKKMSSLHRHRLRTQFVSAQVVLMKRTVMLALGKSKYCRNKEVMSHVKGLAMCYAHILTHHSPLAHHAVFCPRQTAKSRWVCRWFIPWPTLSHFHCTLNSASNYINTIYQKPRQHYLQTTFFLVLTTLSTILPMWTTSSSQQKVIFVNITFYSFSN